MTWRDHKNESTDLHLLRFSLVAVFIYKRSLSTQTINIYRCRSNDAKFYCAVDYFQTYSVHNLGFQHTKRNYVNG